MNWKVHTVRMFHLHSQDKSRKKSEIFLACSTNVLMTCRLEISHVSSRVANFSRNVNKGITAICCLPFMGGQLAWCLFQLLWCEYKAFITEVQKDQTKFQFYSFFPLSGSHLLCVGLSLSLYFFSRSALWKNISSQNPLSLLFLVPESIGHSNAKVNCICHIVYWADQLDKTFTKT